MIGSPGASQANVEYFYRLIYECIFGGCRAGLDLSTIAAFLAKLWLWIVAIGYVVSVVALFVIIYCTVRLFELRKREEEYYSTLILPADEKSGGHPRWAHIESLAEGKTQHEWRQAIIEADILLHETLTKAGYSGDTVGEKLKTADSSGFETLQDAWEAHKVRNQIAHEGSHFELSESIAQRTLARYAQVFREFKVI